MMEVNGFEFSGIHCGIKESKKDLGLVYIKDGATAVGVTTKNIFASPAVKHTKEILGSTKPVYSILVNSGNANALTGSNGYDDICKILESQTELTKQAKNSGIMLSTGIIGQRLPIDKIIDGLSPLINGKSKSCDNFATAICTTDTIEKVFLSKVEINNEMVTILGIAKGSGMIQPNMATMLSFIFTDANIDQALLQEALSSATDKSFNRITVDSDSSTNDTCLFLASNTGPKIDKTSIQAFKSAVDDITLKLAQSIILDGEGATKFVELSINNAKSNEEAKRIFYAIANSPLVKTALFGENPNFGRILCSAGKVQSSIIPKKTILSIGTYILYKNGEVTTFDQDALNKYMTNKNIQICLDLGIGNINFTGWTTDLSHDYIDINAEYN